MMSIDGETLTVTPSYLQLCANDSKPDIFLRGICFGIPFYRLYLLAILAHGLVGAGQVPGDEYRQRVAHWVSRDLPHLAGELNQLLDGWENGRDRLIDRPPAEVTAHFAAWHEGHESFAEWDRQLLGVSGAPEQLFTAVLHHAAAFTTPTPMPEQQQQPIALLPPFELTPNGSGSLALPPPCPWTRARQRVHSSLPFYDGAERPLFDAAQHALIIWQDMLAQQPYYRAILRLFIAARFSDYSGETCAVRFADDWSTARLYWADKPGNSLAALWPGLVQGMGYWPGTAVAPADLQRVLAHWHKVEVISATADGRLTLTDAYARTLHERRRAQQLLRGAARAEQEQVNALLRRGA
ncbi:MAG: hypothetical protein IPM39_19385 [Chloroflexi bacterium]|nr:hypothetical protein [Chloroflexota bacterium]